ncbi:MAG TPA: glycosyltransferase family protein [Candidatus Avalokitesvara rifleensis]|uniref:glycosyltransferase family protein n=1 Tax=Candidatus Avalokitesvara rifleensis TaxID=3367620 RepID=UPI0040272EA3
MDNLPVWEKAVARLRALDYPEVFAERYLSSYLTAAPAPFHAELYGLMVSNNRNKREAVAETVKGLVDTPVYVLPNQIDFADIERLTFSARKRPSIGWAGGHYHVQDLGLVENALEDVLEKYPEIVLIMYGACPKGLYERKKARIFLQPFMPVGEFHFWMASFRFDIGIAPLYKTEFAKSRSNLRLLQYAAMKIPVVASNYGEYGRALGSGLAGITAEDDQWVDRIGYLIEHPDEREELSKEAHNYVRENYDMEKSVNRWSTVYEEVLTR